MIAALIIVFREVLEAALIVSIVLVATAGLPKAKVWVGGGILAGLIGSAVVAQFAGAISHALSGFGQEIFNASILLIAVVMLAWHNAWMAAHGRELAGEMQAVGKAVSTGERPLYALASVVGLAVMREGSETVLFLYGLAASDGGFSNALIGGAAGLALGAAVGAGLYFGMLRIPTRHLFRVTTWMIALLAAGMAAQSMSFLSAAGVLSLGPVMWDSSFLLSQNSLIGKVLHTLIGYIDRPRQIQLISYVLTLLAIYLTTVRANRQERARG